MKILKYYALLNTLKFEIFPGKCFNLILNVFSYDITLNKKLNEKEDLQQGFVMFSFIPA